MEDMEWKLKVGSYPAITKVVRCWNLGGIILYYDASESFDNNQSGWELHARNIILGMSWNKVTRKALQEGKEAVDKSPGGSNSGKIGA